MNGQRPRVPESVDLALLGFRQTVQVNHCRQPSCANFGVPARTEPGKTGPSPDRDMNYKVHSTHKGQVPSIKCKSCGENPPMKSNAAVAEEARRLADVSGLPRLGEVVGCRNPDCENHARPIALNPMLYRKCGQVRGAPNHQCKACGRKTLLSRPTRLHGSNRALAVDVFSRIANKSPVRGTARGSGLKSTDSYYAVLNFIHERCREMSGRADRAMLDGRMRLPKDLNLESDCQVHQLNWISRLDRRNVELSALCTVDVDSRFILGMHSNFDDSADPLAVNAEAARNGDMDAPEPFRRHARYWLAGDELRSGRAMSRTVHDRDGLISQIRALYADAASRADVENIELHHHNEAYVTPFLSNGLQVHLPYAAYAHWVLLRRLLSGAGVGGVQVNMDIDSMNRAAFLCAFVDEVKRGDAHAFFVRYDKFKTVDERRRILEEAKRRRSAFVRSLPPDVRKDRREVARRMMKASMASTQRHGKWRDQWADHPLPTMNEPRKAVCWLTANADVDEDRKADMHLRAGLARIDNVFQMTRRLFNAFERPVGTSSGHNAVWHGYAPYNPAMVQKYLTIFRTVNNWVHVSEKDGKTPAMRLGFARKPLGYEDILWAGQRVPRAKRSRRKGMKAAA